MSASSLEVASVHAQPRVERLAPRQAALEDHGPWLFLAAPISFALVLAFIIYISAASF